MRPVDARSWRELLTQWNAHLLQTPDIVDGLPPDAVASGWLGYPGATEEQLLRVEARLGTTLPPSYREFLKASNGWRCLGHFHWTVWSAQEIDWFRVRNQVWIDAYTEPWLRDGAPAVSDDEYFVYGEGQSDVTFRMEYLPSLLEVSDTGDSVILLLNPHVAFSDGEWEAWDFGTWYPGAHRYRSFWDMMQTLHRRFLDLRDEKSGR